MIALGQISHHASSGELQVAAWATMGLCGYGLWALGRRFFSGPKCPDPWDETVAAEIEDEHAVPLCHRCLTPHDSLVNFCPHCGASVGNYTNWLPFPYLFSIGHTLRIGTSGEYKRTGLTILGFIVFSFVEYAVFAPIYWVLFLLKIPPRRTSKLLDDQPPVSNPG